MTERHRFPVLVHVLIVSADRLLLLRRAGTGRFDGCWAPPGGHMEAGETPRAAAVRELREESGIELEGEQLEAVGLMHYLDGGGGFNLLFAATLPERLPPTFDPLSADDAAWWPRQALPEPRVAWLDAALQRAERNLASPPGPTATPWYGEGH